MPPPRTFTDSCNILMVKSLNSCICLPIASYLLYKSIMLLFNESLEMRSNFPAFIISKKVELFIRLKNLKETRAILQKKFSQFSLIESPVDLKKENSFLHKIHSVIEENLTNPQFNVAELAKQMFLSRMQLHRKIKAISNRTTSNYIRSYRLHKSKPQLSDLGRTISEVAWDVGFKDVNYYSKSFQSEFGMSPSEYRNTIAK